MLKKTSKIYSNYIFHLPMQTNTMITLCLLGTRWMADTSPRQCILPDIRFLGFSRSLFLLVLHEPTQDSSLYTLSLQSDVKKTANITMIYVFLLKRKVLFSVSLIYEINHEKDMSTTSAFVDSILFIGYWLRHWWRIYFKIWI